MMMAQAQKHIFYGMFVVMAAVSTGWAQQDPLSSQYLSNYFLINPAYAGMTKDLNLSAGYRSQWAGFSGSPVTFTASGHISLNTNKMGVGFTAIQDKIGSDRTTEFNAAYSYHIPLKDGLEFSFGLQGGMINYHSDYSDLHINPNDPKFTNISEFKPNIGAGVLVRSENFMFSISVPHLLPRSHNVDSLTTGLYSQNLYVFGSYMHALSYRVKFKPSILLRATRNAAVSVDYVLALKMDDSYTLGVFTRNFNTLGFQALLNIGDAFRVGYVFEMPLSPSSTLNFTSHEIMCGMRIKALSFHNIEEVKSY